MSCQRARRTLWKLEGGSEGKEAACNAGDTGGVGSTPGLGRSPGEGNRDPLQYSWMENSMDGGVWWATVLGVTKSWTRLRVTNTHIFWGGIPCFSQKWRETQKSIMGKHLQILSLSYQLPLTTSSSNFKDVKTIAGFHVHSSIDESGAINMAWCQ